MIPSRPIILPLAKKDIREAANWYEQQHRGLGRRFTDDVRKIIKSVANNPYAYSIRYVVVRTALLSDFPFMIHFFVQENSTFLISVVLHTSRSENIWLERNK